MERLVCFCLGVALVAVLPDLPDWRLCLLPLVLAWPARRYLRGVGLRVCYGVLILCCAMAWASWRAQLQLTHGLSAAEEGIPLVLEGRVRGLATRNDFATRFDFVPDNAPAGVPDVVLARDYLERDWPAGSRWRLSLRLRAPRAEANPYGFDGEAWMWSQGLLASGSVGKYRVALGQEEGMAAALDRLRARLVARIFATLGDGREGGLVAALAVGAQGELPRTVWRELAATGTTHLVSISGVHVTMVALLAGCLMRGLLFLLPRLVRTPQTLVILAGVGAAFAYALLAGFSVPTQRTVLALTLAGAMLLARRGFTPFQIWWSSLALVLLMDPFAVLTPGLWLSFGLVAALIVAGMARRRPLYGWRDMLGGQWAVLVVSPLPLLWFFGQLPLVSPLANLLAIPWITLVVTPLALLGLFDPTGWLLHLAGVAAQGFFWGLAFLARFPTLALPAAPWPLTILALAGSLLVLLPLAWCARLFGVLLMVPLLFYPAPVPDAGHFRARLIDVGQGLALLVQTRRHSLLFDTGAGEAGRILLPQLQGLGVRRLDVLVLSHHDADHMGAAASLLAILPASRILSGQVGKMRADGIQALPCQAGQSWAWDGVRFDMLAPAVGERHGDDNAASCVLRVATLQQALLVTGDLPQARERALLVRYGAALRASVLVLGHHGSRTSSSAEFLAGVAPQWALSSNGYRNRYRHPHGDVLARVAASGARLLRTDESGALQIDVSDRVTIRTWRHEAPRYWRFRQAGSD
ncbi:DNA internalization-related competence protein ComEC/Rec2 [Craterilacuibacter sinensis]|uniref:DNA internalization-related competence protein ComEC/Rec2 n=1 Tax=Craterilacuibacter sinensis TaxID=2686017 RepID=A0A845BS67_9NEIS|nr:DNA internalization-related competence protein ComEC/Rec2 [Craterilacuibacter sinensis]MXR38240.1 DNA internalization-related competence protein ComEC/Rec2 [Craterilacuibacter sinensis]